MSWARVDDEAWYHEKFQELQEQGVDGMAAIGLWVMALSLTGQKHSPKLTLAEATMLCGGDRDLALKCFVLLHDTSLADIPPCFATLEESLASKTPSTIIHDWAKYRSRDEAKALAGRKGGKKSGEIRRQKAKQNRSKAEANVKQSRSNTPSPDPDPDPDPEPDPCMLIGEESTKKVTLGEFQDALQEAQICLSMSSTEQQRYSKLTPVRSHEVAHAIEVTKGKGISRAAYLLTIIESDREKAEAVRNGPAPPAAGMSAEEIRIKKRDKEMEILEEQQRKIDELIARG